MSQFIKSRNRMDGSLIINLEHVAAFTSSSNGGTIDFRLSTGESVSWHYHSREDRDTDLKRIYDFLNI